MPVDPSINNMIAKREQHVNSLQPLLYRKSFTLKVNKKRIRKRVHVDSPEMYFFPLCESSKWLVAMPGHGSEVLDLANFHPIVFTRVGLSMADSKVLCNAITDVLLRGK